LQRKREKIQERAGRGSQISSEDKVFASSSRFRGEEKKKVLRTGGKRREVKKKRVPPSKRKDGVVGQQGAWLGGYRPREKKRNRKEIESWRRGSVSLKKECLEEEVPQSGSGGGEDKRKGKACQRDRG